MIEAKSLDITPLATGPLGGGEGMYGNCGGPNNTHHVYEKPISPYLIEDLVPTHAYIYPTLLILRVKVPTVPLLTPT